jgi:hypothetical protein
MAKVEMNKLMEALSGAIGGLVFRQMPDGSVVVSAAPRYGGRKRKSSKRQKAHQSRFKEAAMYARYAAKVHPIYAELARGTVKSAYNFALSDWFNPPVIHQVQRREAKILVQASDNIRVTRVQVTVLDCGRKSNGEGRGDQERRRLVGVCPFTCRERCHRRSLGPGRTCNQIQCVGRAFGGSPPGTSSLHERRDFRFLEYS